MPLSHPSDPHPPIREDVEINPLFTREPLDGAARRAADGGVRRKNMIDKDEYPRTAELENRCVHMLAAL